MWEAWLSWNHKDHKGNHKNHKNHKDHKDHKDHEDHEVTPADSLCVLRDLCGSSIVVCSRSLWFTIFVVLEANTQREAEQARDLVIVERLRLPERRAVVPIDAFHRRRRERVEGLKAGVVEPRVDADVPAQPTGVVE